MKTNNMNRIIIRVRRRRRASELTLRQILYHVWQAAFAVIVIAIFVLVWFVQGGTITMPEWTKDLGHLSDADWTKYSAILASAVCVVFAIVIITGLALVRSDKNHGYSG